jgi:hypothetical protein
MLGLFPILSLWSTNFDRVKPLEIIRPLALAFVCSLILYLILRVLLRDWGLAALISSLAILLYFAYGHIFGLVDKVTVLGINIGRHRVLIGVWFLLFSTGACLILRNRKRLFEFNRLINAASLALNLIVLLQLAYLQFHSYQTRLQFKETMANSAPGAVPPGLKSAPDSPDVYLIVLDAYLRDDKLYQRFNLDNSAFLKQLTDMGFIIPSCTQSNYAWTLFSMSSMFNMEYLDQLAVNLDPNQESMEYDLLSEYIKHSLVRKIFNHLGYQMITFQTSFEWIDIPDSDVYFPEMQQNSTWNSIMTPTEFDNMVTLTSAWLIVDQAGTISPVLGKLKSRLDLFFTPQNASADAIQRTGGQRRYAAIMSELNQIQDVPKIPGKKFVYLHIPAPHSYFVLGPDGNYFHTEDQDIGYPNAVTYLNKRIIPILQGIIKNSKTPPVIILQGDHGWVYDPNLRTFILNAYYIPGKDPSAVYPSITPVNSFRMLFDQYFGGDYAMLKDTSYYSVKPGPYKFLEIPVKCPREKLLQ